MELKLVFFVLFIVIVVVLIPRYLRVVPRAGNAPVTGEHRVVEVIGSRLVVEKT